MNKEMILTETNDDVDHGYVLALLDCQTNVLPQRTPSEVQLVIYNIDANVIVKTFRDKIKALIVKLANCIDVGVVKRKSESTFGNVCRQELTQQFCSI